MLAARIGCTARALRVHIVSGIENYSPPLLEMDSIALIVIVDTWVEFHREALLVAWSVIWIGTIDRSGLTYWNTINFHGAADGTCMHVHVRPKHLTWAEVELICKLFPNDPRITVGAHCRVASLIACLNRVVRLIKWCNVPLSKRVEVPHISERSC